MKTVKIYPAGGVKKGEKDDGKVSWTDSDMDVFRRVLLPHSIHFIDPRYRNDNLNDSMAVFGRDLMAVRVSDFVVVDAREKRGIGVGQEMMFAKLEGIPVIAVAPKGGHYLKGKLHYLGQTVENYVHPFLIATSDVIVENFEQAAEWIKDFLQSPKEVKDEKTIKKAIDLYVRKYLDGDEPLKNAVKDDTG